MKKAEEVTQSTTAKGKKGKGFNQSQRTSPLAENLVRDARVCQGRQDRLLFPKRAEVQHEVRGDRLQRCGEPRRRRPVASRLRAEEVDRRRRGKNRRAVEESSELRTWTRHCQHSFATLPIRHLIGIDINFNLNLGKYPFTASRN